MTILDEIVANKRNEVLARANRITVQELMEKPFYEEKCISAKAAILDPNKTGIITEFKRQSPSKGLINVAENTVEEVVLAYQKAGASVVSILTDYDFFGGDINDLRIAKELLDVPVLRKDFIVNEYQVYETKAIGADLILLIAECLTAEQVEKLAKVAQEVGLEVLLEMHSEAEIHKINPYIDLVGINNRDLKTFAVDLEKSKSLLKKLPTELVKIAESGISDPATVLELKEAGFQGFLIGENFMKTADPGAAFADFVKELEK